MDGWKTIFFLKGSLFSGHSFIFRWGFHVLPFVWIPVVIAARCIHWSWSWGPIQGTSWWRKLPSFFSPKIGEIWHWSTILHQTKFSYHFKRRSIFSTQKSFTNFRYKNMLFSPLKLLHKFTVKTHLLRFAACCWKKKYPVIPIPTTKLRFLFGSGFCDKPCLKKSPAFLHGFFVMSILFFRGP